MRGKDLDPRDIFTRNPNTFKVMLDFWAFGVNRISCCDLPFPYSEQVERILGLWGGLDMEL